MSLLVALKEPKETYVVKSTFSKTDRWIGNTLNQGGQWLAIHLVFIAITLIVVNKLHLATLGILWKEHLPFGDFVKRKKETTFLFFSFCIIFLISENMDFLQDFQENHKLCTNALEF